MQEANQLTTAIIDGCRQVHKALGIGLIDTAYQQTLYEQLLKKGLFVQRQVPIYAFYKLIRTEVEFKADFIVENTVICDIKSVTVIKPVCKRGLNTYLHLANKQLGLLINFNEQFIEDGITKVINKHYQPFY